MRRLIAYYSRAGNNYVSGQIVNLPVGNTEIAAKKIKKLRGGDLFRIDTVKPYPVDYRQTTEAAKLALRQNARPELSMRVENMTEYQIVCLGYPNWCGTMPMAVFTFLEAYDFAGKTIIPFCTHEGSGMARSERDIKRLCPDATLKEGLPIIGGTVHEAESDIALWIRTVDEIQ